MRALASVFYAVDPTVPPGSTEGSTSCSAGPAPGSRRTTGTVRRSRDLARAAPGPRRLLALAVVAAQGIGASRPSNGFVGVLGRQLAAATGQPVQVVNLSRSGARIRDVLDTQLPALAALDRTPDLVTVAIGGNDVRAR